MTLGELGVGALQVRVESHRQSPGAGVRPGLPPLLQVTVLPISHIMSSRLDWADLLKLPWPLSQIEHKPQRLVNVLQPSWTKHSLAR